MKKVVREIMHRLSCVFAISSVSFFAIMLVCIGVFGWKRGPTKTAKQEDISQNQEERVQFFIQNESALTDYRAEIEKILSLPRADTELLSDLLWEYQNYNKSVTDISEKIDNSLYISKIYLSFDGKINDAVELAMEEIEYNQTIIDGLKDEKTKYELENLSMLSTIYQMMGRKHVEERMVYYPKAIDCLGKLLENMSDAEGDLYYSRLYELIDMECEIGKKDSAIKKLEEVMENGEINSNQLYIKYVLLLLENDGNQEKLEDLYEKIKNRESMKEDFRYEQICRQIEEYIYDK